MALQILADFFIENRDDWKVMIFPGHFSIEEMNTKLL